MYLESKKTTTHFGIVDMVVYFIITLYVSADNNQLL
ncbi:unnamed protein product [Tenebrio molitor]|nr:unnamed protein product [Tenebrio molitor]